MSEYRASFRRVVQHQQYETETVELAITMDAPEGSTEGDMVQWVDELYRALSSVGDQIVADRLAVVQAARAR